MVRVGLLVLAVLAGGAAHGQSLLTYTGPDRARGVAAAQTAGGEQANQWGLYRIVPTAGAVFLLGFVLPCLFPRIPQPTNEGLDFI